ncbi:unnamed protein product, partial [Closterium sp. NIES-53]
TAQALYDAVLTRYSSPATAVLGRLLLPYLVPELSAFATVEDLVSHLRTSDARYRATVRADFLDRNQPLMFITLYFIVTCLRDSLRSDRDHLFSLDPTVLTVDLLEQHLFAAETSAVVVGAARGTPRLPFFEGCSPFPLAPSYASVAASDVSVTEDVGAASTSAKRNSSKGKGGRGGGGGSGGGGGGSGSGGGGSKGGGGGSRGDGAVGLVAGVGSLVAAVEAAVGVAAMEAVGLVAVGLDLGVEALVVANGSSSSVRARPSRPSSSIQHRCFSHLDDAWRGEFGDEVERPRWADLLRFGVAIFDLDYHVILSAMYALSASAEGDCYRCVPSDPRIAAAALGASESGTLPGTTPAEALHSFTLDSGTSRCFFRDSTTLTPLLTPVSVRLADPSGGPVVARSSTVLSCPAVPSGSLSGSSLYTLATKPPQIAASAQVSASGQVAASCSCRLLSHQTLLWHHRLGHSSLPRLRGMHSRLLVFGRPRSLPPLPPSPAPPCLPCVEGWQRAAPHSSSFSPTTTPLQTLDIDGPAPSGVSQVDPLPGTAPVKVAVGLGAARGAASGGAASGGAEPGGARSEGAGSEGAEHRGEEPRGAEPEGVEPGGAESEGAESGGAEPWGAASSGGPAGASPRVSPKQLHEWLVRRTRLRSGATGAGGTGDAGARGAGVTSGAGGTGGTAAAGPGGAPTRGGGAAGTGGVGGAGAGDPTELGAAGAGGSCAGGAGARGAGAGGARVGGTGAGGAGAAGAGVVYPGAGGAGGTVRPRLYFVPLLQQVLGVPSSTSLTPPLLCPPPDQVQPALLRASPLPAPSPYTEQSGGLTERHEPASHPVSPVRTARRVPRSRPPPVPSTHAMALRPSSVPLRFPLRAPPESSLPEVPDPESDRARAASPTVSRLLATALIDPSFESAAASALVAELLDFAAACRLDYATARVAESASASPPSIGLSVLFARTLIVLQLLNLVSLPCC